MTLVKNPAAGIVLELFGPTLEFLTSPDDERNDFCVIRGTIPPGISVPLHSHPDTEDFLVLSGRVEGLRHGVNGYQWISASEGDFVHVPSSAPHAWRNRFDEPAVTLIITTRRLARFFRQAGRPLTSVSRRPTPEELNRFAELCAQYDCWNASPEENAAVGIEMSF